MTNIEYIKDELTSYKKHVEELQRSGSFNLNYPKAKAIIEALEKQIPKKPIYHWDGNEEVVLCPHCKRFPFDTDYYKWARQFCGNCGQAIDWSERK